MKQLLLLSSSRTDGTAPLEHARDFICDFLGRERRRIVFVPFAAVTISYREYLERARSQLEPWGYTVEIVAADRAPTEALADADAVMVGGGNSFQLLRELQRTGLLEAIRERVLGGLPYLGWSAGSNMACPTIRTTNDMPIVEPADFQALGLVPFQINPHYTDAHPPGHQGETRDDRIAEFLIANPQVTVLGLREGSAVRVEGDGARLLGKLPARLFRNGMPPADLPGGADLGELMD